MATLLLTAVGTIFGGPVGGAIGALAGRTIDGAVFGGGKREGPRLKELALTTSSYGQAIPRQHGRMRSGGTIVWATDLVENKEKSGGKKGQPSVTSYSYTTSFAVALSSRPIRGVGRIWADGNLLRGAAGDLKAAGTMRLYLGGGDQPADPLIVADKGAEGCPAFRDCAYVVFEDLALADFGNRIPALSFEIIADEGAIALADIVDSAVTGTAGASMLDPLGGFALEGGPLAGTLATIDTLFPLTVDAGGDRLSVATAGQPDTAAIVTLPPAARAWAEDDFGTDDGQRRDRETGDGDRPDAVRYYDIARDFQPGVQRPAGRAEPGRNRTIEFPGALAADDARSLTEAAVRRAAWGRDRLQWRVAELDPSLAPGREVRVPGKPGVWRIEGWEWRSKGIELDLVRRNPLAALPATADAGTVPGPPDRLSGPTVLMAFEVPATTTNPAGPSLFAAAGSASSGWRGAALYVERAGELVPVGSTGRSRATIGSLASPLPSSAGFFLEASASVEIALVDPEAVLAPTTVAGIAQGANRMRVGGEILQFLDAEHLGGGVWRLTGLLRARGGTEAAALAGHTVGEPVTLLDETIVALGPTDVPSNSSTVIAAIGLDDKEPVRAPLENAGLSTRPPSPVHPRIAGSTDSGLELAWTRRARGAWIWPDGIDVPLVEQTEAYRVGLGPVDMPYAQWEMTVPRLDLPADVVSSLAQAHPGAVLWVRQIGSFALSDPLMLAHLS